MGGAIKILIAIVMGLKFIPRVYHKIKDSIYKYHIRKLQGEVFDAQASVKYHKAGETLAKQAKRDSEEKSIDEILNHFSK